MATVVLPSGILIVTSYEFRTFAGSPPIAALGGQQSLLPVVRNAQTSMSWRRIASRNFCLVVVKILEAMVLKQARPMAEQIPMAIPI